MDKKRPKIKVDNLTINVYYLIANINIYIPAILKLNNISILFI